MSGRAIYFTGTISLVIGIAAACAPAILGGPTPDTTTTLCGDGVTRCPNPYVCTLYDRCEAPGPAPTSWGSRLADAGKDR